MGGSSLGPARDIRAARLEEAEPGRDADAEKDRDGGDPPNELWPFLLPGQALHDRSSLPETTVNWAKSCVALAQIINWNGARLGEPVRVRPSFSVTSPMHFFSSAGVRIAYADFAAPGAPGEPVLLIHGFASNHAINWVNTLWTKTLGAAGYRVIALDNRGHGQSEKLYDPASYESSIMAEDARRLLDHLGVERADVMGYSMGARIAAHLALAEPARVRSLLMGGLGIHLVEGVGLPLGIADAMEAPSADVLTDPMQRMFRLFAEQTRSDLKALAACIRGSRQVLSRAEIGSITTPTLVAVGGRDDVAGSGQALADLMPNARFLDIPDRDHNLAVGDKVHKQGVLAFLAERP
jgi:pimeloyl-ACP methyl ester carboxylesterase